MRASAFFFFLLAPLSALAVDTSGCSQLNEVTKVGTSASGAAFHVTLQRAPRPDCWNFGTADIVVRYEFVVPSGTFSPRVQIWTSVNGKARTQDAQTSCQYHSNGTSGEGRFECAAYISTPAPNNGPVQVELAAAVNQIWDTTGYGQNTRLQF